MSKVIGLISLYVFERFQVCSGSLYPFLTLDLKVEAKFL